MADQQGMGPGMDRPPTEEELRAAYEQQVKQLRIDDVVIETVVSLINLSGRKAGLAPGTEDERDLDQLKLGIDAARALLPLVEERLGPDSARVREVLSQLQMAYVQGTGGGAEQPGSEPGEQGPPEGGAQPGPGGPGSAQSSGRLWVPGQ